MKKRGLCSIIKIIIAENSTCKLLPKLSPCILHGSFIFFYGRKIK